MTCHRSLRAAAVPAALSILVLFAAVAFTGAPAAAQERPINIAVVDLELIVARSAAGQELQQKLDAFQKTVQAEIDRMQAEAREIRQRMADGVNSLTEDKLTELQKEYEDKTIAIRRFRDDKNREGQKMQNEGLREIEQQLEPVFEKVRDEGGYDLILNRVPGVVVMAGERVDITQKVIDSLDSTAAGN